jgi:hypothetical protein
MDGASNKDNDGVDDYESLNNVWPLDEDAMHLGLNAYPGEEYLFGDGDPSNGNDTGSKYIHHHHSSSSGSASRSSHKRERGLPHEVMIDPENEDGFGGSNHNNHNSSSHNSSSGANSSNKKRFVWPDSLHRDFMVAVFDVGLRVRPATEHAPFHLLPTCIAHRTCTSIYHVHAVLI